MENVQNSSSAYNDIIAATSTSSLVSAITSSLISVTSGSSFSFEGLGSIDNNSAVFDGGGMATPDAELDDGNYILNTLVGLLIVLTASVFNALGLNLTKLDHVQQQAIPKRQRKKEYMRLLWLSGMGMYIASQVLGSPLALKYLRPDWVAPLGSSSLVFNFMFAYWLVGTPVTTTDIRGTAIIILGVILIIVFSSINHGLIQGLSIHRLNGLWSRPAWIAYLILIVAFTSVTYLTSSFLGALVSSRASFSPLPSPSLELPASRPSSPGKVVSVYRTIRSIWARFRKLALDRMEILFSRTGDERLTWLQGIGWAVAGGSLAGLCLVFTKAVVKIFWLPGHPLVHPSALISLLSVIITAILQIICLNKALVCADTVVVVPLFYAGYTVLGFINSLIFYDEVGQYARWVLIAVFLSIAILISGVVLLSLKSSTKTAADPYTISTEPSSINMRLRPTQTKTKLGQDAEAGQADSLGNDNRTGLSTSRENVLWEVGSVGDDSDTEHEAEGKGKGVGGIRGGSGERRGLLGEEERDIHEEDDGHAMSRPESATQDDDFGEYEDVTTDDPEKHSK
ncbi:uncharacterized protein L203_100472 [Cryptococcus depauperatus CBS 7841]|uniref:Uncharacterized protein n=1 Tax=Cryptococcus depauperatus CBS 7841 TaxID=1295531 RepID=A0A1E3HLV5_9TREE|nr:hypothetical protein L203_06277 [Cryptococcus depauperatus CBS 7841]